MSNKKEIVRVLRVLEYVGPRDWVEFTMSKNAEMTPEEIRDAN